MSQDNKSSIIELFFKNPCSSISKHGNSNCPANKPFCGLLTIIQVPGLPSTAATTRCRQRFAFCCAAAGKRVTERPGAARARARQRLRRGQRSQEGDVGVQIVAPSSMRAWLKTPTVAQFVGIFPLDKGKEVLILQLRNFKATKNNTPKPFKTSPLQLPKPIYTQNILLVPSDPPLLPPSPNRSSSTAATSPAAPQHRGGWRRVPRCRPPEQPLGQKQWRRWHLRNGFLCWFFVGLCPVYGSVRIFFWCCFC